MRTEEEVSARINYLKEQIKLSEKRVLLYRYTESLCEAEKDFVDGLWEKIRILQWATGENNCARTEFKSPIARAEDFVLDTRTEHKCPKCNLVKDVSEFYFSRRKRDSGKKRISTYCRGCIKLYDKERNLIKNELQERIE